MLDGAIGMLSSGLVAVDWLPIPLPKDSDTAYAAAVEAAAVAAAAACAFEAQNPTARLAHRGSYRW